MKSIAWNSAKKIIPPFQHTRDCFSLSSGQLEKQHENLKLQFIYLRVQRVGS